MLIYWNERRGGSKGSMSFTTSDVSEDHFIVND